MKHVYLIAVMLVISACSATGLVYKNIDAPSDGKSALYIYRPPVFQNSVISPGIILDGQELLLMKNGGYTYIQIEEGQHTLNVLLSEKYKGNSEIIFSTKANAKTFIKLKTYNHSVDNNTFKRVFQLEETSENEAIVEISKCVYLDPKSSKKFKKSIFINN
jgi:hypothetical protein